MTKSEWTDFIILELKNNGTTFINIGRSNEGRAAYMELIELGLIKDVGAQSTLTGNGIVFSKSGLSLDDWLNKNHSRINNVLNYNINAPVHHSDFSNNLNAENRIITAPKNNNKLEKIYWIVGILVGICLVILGYLTLIR